MRRRANWWSVAWNTRSGEARAFYAGLGGLVRVGIEATGHTRWFERMLGELGHELWIGDAAQIRA